MIYYNCNRVQSVISRLECLKNIECLQKNEALILAFDYCIRDLEEILADPREGRMEVEEFYEKYKDIRLDL